MNNVLVATTWGLTMFVPTGAANAKVKVIRAQMQLRFHIAYTRSAENTKNLWVNFAGWRNKTGIRTCCLDKFDEREDVQKDRCRYAAIMIYSSRYKESTRKNYRPLEVVRIEL